MKIELPEQVIRDIANGLNGVQPTLGQWQRDLRLARAVEQATRERIAQHFDSLDKGAGGFYDPHEPAEIIRSL